MRTMRAFQREAHTLCAAPCTATALLTRYRAPARRISLVLGVLLLLALTGPAAAVGPTPSPALAASVSLAPDDLAAGMLALMNDERDRAGLPELNRTDEVDQVAVARAVDMASAGYFEHFNAAGIGAEQLLIQFGVGYRILGENIARSTYPANEIVRSVNAAIMASDQHRSNVLERRFSRTGIGVASADGVFYVAVVFLD